MAGQLGQVAGSQEFAKDLISESSAFEGLDEPDKIAGAQAISPFVTGGKALWMKPAFGFRKLGRVKSLCYDIDPGNATTVEISSNKFTQASLSWKRPLLA